MAKYDVTYACGHVVSVQLYGAMKDRMAQIRYIQSCICSECYDNELMQIAEKAGLPVLSGTPKDVSKALRIRHRQIEGLKRLTEMTPGETGARGSSTNASPSHSDNNEELLQAGLAATSATWWIEHADDF